MNEWLWLSGLSLALSADAAAVTAGLCLRAGSLRPLAPAMAWFGGAQLVAALVGAIGGTAAQSVVGETGQLLAGIALIAVGVSMWRTEVSNEVEPPGVLQWAGLAIATSIDAAAAGLSLPLSVIPVPFSVGVIGGGTAAVVGGSGFIAVRAGATFGPLLLRVGAVILCVSGLADLTSWAMQSTWF